MNVLITGSSGYLGKELSSFLENKGFGVVRCSRQKKISSESELFYSIEGYKSFQLPKDIDAVIHLAALTQAKCTGQISDIEVDAAVDLCDKSVAQGCKFIFISSLSAQDCSLTTYGKTKFEIERKLKDKPNALIVRPGLIYGGEPSGLYGSIVNLADKLPVIPVFKPEPIIQIAHISHVCSGVKKICEQLKNEFSEVNLISKSMAFSSFLESISIKLIKKELRFIRIPSPVTKLLSKFFTVTKLNPLGINNYLSLSMDYKLYEPTQGFSVFDCASEYIFHGYIRRYNILESRALLEYVLGMKPSLNNIKRYVRAIDVLKEGKPLYLSLQCLYSPYKIGFYDNLIFKDQDLRDRLNIAMTIAECSPQGFNVFVNSKHNSIGLSTIKAISSLSFEFYVIISSIFKKLMFKNKLYRSKDYAV